MRENNNDFEQSAGQNFDNINTQQIVRENSDDLEQSAGRIFGK